MPLQNKKTSSKQKIPSQEELNQKINECDILTSKYTQLEFNYTEIETIRNKYIETNESFLRIRESFDEFKRKFKNIDCCFSLFYFFLLLQNASGYFQTFSTKKENYLISFDYEKLYVYLIINFYIYKL